MAPVVDLPRRLERRPVVAPYLPKDISCGLNS